MGTRFFTCIPAFVLVAATAWPQTAAPTAQFLTDADREEFLLKAELSKSKGASKGITNTLRCTLTRNGVSHEASVQTIDEYKAKFEGTTGSEINFRDSYKYNLAAYKLDRMLGLNMIPTTVFRKHRGSSASFTWWIDNVLMDEGDRMSRKIEPPIKENWNNQMHIVRVFDQLIYNMDRNVGNLIIDKDWRLWMIDHTRAFRLYYDIKEPKNLQKCDRELLVRLKALNEERMKAELGKWLSAAEITGVLKRRDKIVSFFEKAGDSAMYDMLKRPTE